GLGSPFHETASRTRARVQATNSKQRWLSMSFLMLLRVHFYQCDLHVERDGFRGDIDYCHAAKLQTLHGMHAGQQNAIGVVTRLVLDSQTPSVCRRHGSGPFQDLRGTAVVDPKATAPSNNRDPECLAPDPLVVDPLSE